MQAAKVVLYFKIYQEHVKINIAYMDDNTDKISVEDLVKYIDNLTKAEIDYLTSRIIINSSI